MPEVAFYEAARAFRSARSELTDACVRVLASGSLIMGPEVDAFECELATHLGTAAVVGVASGTDAIELALRSLDAPAGAEVICPSFTATPTGMAILRAGFRPVLVDVDEHSLTLSVDTALAAVGAKTAAIVPVHLYGRPAPVEDLRVAGVSIIEDCAQSFGLSLPGGSAGTLGEAGCFSFYPTKNLGAFGDGGAIAVPDRARAARLRELRSYSESPRYYARAVGLNSRLDELQAALLRVRLPQVEEENRRRMAIASRYDEVLGVESPLGVNHLYVVRSAKRVRLQERLASAGVQALIHYPWTLDQQPAFADSRCVGPLDVSHRAANDVLSLPCHPFLTDDEIETVVRALAIAVREGLIGPHARA